MGTAATGTTTQVFKKDDKGPNIHLTSTYELRGKKLNHQKETTEEKKTEKIYSTGSYVRYGGYYQKKFKTKT